MKTTWGILMALVITAGIGGAVWLRQREKQRAAQQQSAVLQSQVQALESELAETRAREERKFAAAAVRSSAPLNIPASGTPPPPHSAVQAPNPAMLNDPETRALMQKQQRQALAKLADKLVSKDFAQAWNLSLEQTAQVKELVREKAAAGKDLFVAMMFDGLDDNALAQRGREMKQRIEQSDAALRGLLGEDGLKALTEQERLMEHRERVRHIREEIASAGEPLTREQQDSLIAAMNAERQAFTFRVDYDDPSKCDVEHIRDFFSEANLQIHFEDRQQLNARIAERAALSLSPTQVEALKAAQQNQLEQGRLTVKMTTELFNKRRAN